MNTYLRSIIHVQHTPFWLIACACIQEALATFQCSILAVTAGIDSLINYYVSHSSQTCIVVAYMLHIFVNIYQFSLLF